jgi:hypothetical protein
MGAGDTSAEESGTQPGAEDTSAEESGTGREDKWGLRRVRVQEGGRREKAAPAFLGHAGCALSGPRRGGCDMYIYIGA